MGRISEQEKETKVATIKKLLHSGMGQQAIAEKVGSSCRLVNQVVTSKRLLD
jgi:hypothetical protein